MLVFALVWLQILGLTAGDWVAKKSTQEWQDVAKEGQDDGYDARQPQAYPQVVCCHVSDQIGKSFGSVLSLLTGIVVSHGSLELILLFYDELLGHA